MIKTCLQCGAEFVACRKSKRFCSNRCVQRKWRAANRERVRAADRERLNDTERAERERERKRRKRAEKRAQRQPVIRSCARCGTDFDARSRPHRRFCSGPCLQLARRTDPLERERRRVSRRKQFAANPEQFRAARRERNRKSRAANPDYHRNYQRKWRAANLERVAGYMRRFRAAHPELNGNNTTYARKWRGRERMRRILRTILHLEAALKPGGQLHDRYSKQAE